MQRMWDIMMMSKGVAKVGQVCVQASCNHLEHMVKTSSVTQPIVERINQVSLFKD